MSRKKRTKRVKVSALKPKSDTPIQPGTVEAVSHASLFGPTFIAIRSNAEATKGFKASKSLSKMLGEITADLPKPPKEQPLIGATRLVNSLERNRLIQSRMISKMEVAAETVWPGFGKMLGLMLEREAELTKALGVLGVGVA